jgi:hypothetical protein
MFTDIVDSTKRAAALGDREWRLLLDRHDEAARQEIARFRGHAIKNLGDVFLATFDGPARAVRCAATIAARVSPLGIAVRSGLHTGEIELMREDFAGIAGANGACSGSTNVVTESGWNGLDLQRPLLCGTRILRWREQDSNPRSP